MTENGEAAGGAQSAPRPRRFFYAVFSASRAHKMGNMRFFAEIVNALGAELGTEIRYTVIDGQGGYFQNVKRLETFTEELIVFRGGKSGVRVEGKGLSLGKYGGGDAAVRGKIDKVERI